VITIEECEAALEAARSHLARMATHLPTEVSATVIGVWSKAPYKALTIRGALLWRTQELGADAIRSYEDGRLATATLLTRALIETVALHWRLCDQISRWRKMEPKELNNRLNNMLLGWKGDPDFPDAPNVLTMIDHLERQVPGVRNGYDQLSEIVHPNYGGVHGLYAENDENNFVTNLGPMTRKKTPRHAVLMLAATLGIQIEADLRFADAFREWLASLPSLDDPRPPDEAA
jgi:hypothetical protein